MSQAVSYIPSKAWLKNKYYSYRTSSNYSSDLLDANTNVQSNNNNNIQPPVTHPVNKATQNIPGPQSLSLNVYSDASTDYTGIVMCPSSRFTRKRNHNNINTQWPPQYKHCIAAQYLPVSTSNTETQLPPLVNPSPPHKQHNKSNKRHKRDNIKLSNWLDWFKSYIAPESFLASNPIVPPPIQYTPYIHTVKRIVIVGIHGWSLMGGLLGVKATIIANKLCQLAVESVHKHLYDNHIDINTVEIDSIPLHGHGKVDQRVSHYIDHHLPDYKHKIGTADIVYVVSHSQGTMVSVLLLHELLRLQWIKPNKQNITLLNMSGLNHGPFPDLPGDMLSATKELFTYSQCESYNSKRHLQCASDLLTAGCRIMLVASIGDAVVPLYSALWQGVAPHTHLIRAIYIDSNLYAPDFLYTLLCTLLYLLNSNVSGDLLNNNHTLSSVSDLLIHISGFVRGRLLDKNGGAHSAIHREAAVYNCSAEYLFALPDVNTAQYHTNTNTTTTIEPTVNCNSYAMWAVYLTDSFTHSQFNKHILLMRCQQLIQLLYHSGNDTIDGESEYQLLKYLHNNYHPRSKTLRSFRDALIPLFGDLVHDDNESDNNTTDTITVADNSINSTQPEQLVENTQTIFSSKL